MNKKSKECPGSSISFPTACIQCNAFDWHTTFNLSKYSTSEIYLYENGQHQLIRLVNAIICCLHFICFWAITTKFSTFTCTNF